MEFLTQPHYTKQGVTMQVETNEFVFLINLTYLQYTYETDLDCIQFFSFEPSENSVLASSADGENWELVDIELWCDLYYDDLVNIWSKPEQIARYKASIAW